MKLTELIAELQKLHDMTGTEEVYMQLLPSGNWSEVGFVQLECDYDEHKNPVRYYVMIERD